MIGSGLSRAALTTLLRRHMFDNKRFWNRRYAQDPDFGSGPGSRGEHLLIKNALIREAVNEHGVQSVLDIGCGDIFIMGDIEVRSYLGIDISDVVVERNRLARPEWTFICADLAGAFAPEPADLVLCLDVLIHQRRRRQYDAILGKALSATRKVCLISGYTEADPGWNVFFHEPLCHSVKRVLPNSNVTKVLDYRNTDLLKVVL